VLASMLGDGPYWHSAIEILGPPSGVSFYRRFNYRVDWVHDGLLNRLPDKGRLGPVPGVIGMRFNPRDADGKPDADQGHLRRIFVPLRLAHPVLLTRDGDVAVDLVLGDYIHIDEGSEDFHELTIPGAQLEKGGQPVLLRLATSNELSVINAWSTGPRPDYRIWRLLVESPKLSRQARKQFTDRVVLYATGAHELGTAKAVKPEALGETQATDRLPTQGYRLKVGKEYEIELEMRRVGSIGQPTPPPGPPDFELLNDTTTVRASSITVPFTGNYRQTPVWVRPLVHQAVPLDLWWHPRANGTSDLNVGLRIPFVADRQVPWLSLVVAIVALVLGGFFFFQAFRSGASGPQTAVFLSLGTLLVTAGVTQARDVSTRWERQSGD
jgi:hypothetical protein